jgi:signal transduction histidine kinase
MELHYEPELVRLLVQDDGCGFDAQRPVNSLSHHFGLTAMRERAEKLGGRLFITTSPGEGAIIEAEIPG